MGETQTSDERVRERDLDHFLAEELQADAGLRGWSAAQLVHVFDEPDGATVRVGKSPQRAVDGRQADVRVEHLDGSGVLTGAQQPVTPPPSPAPLRARRARRRT